MVKNKFLTSFILLNNIYLTKCEDKEIEFSTNKGNLQIGDENINFKGDKYILTIDKFVSLNDLENKLKKKISEKFVLKEFTAYTSDDKILEKNVNNHDLFFLSETKKKKKKRVVSPNIKFKVKFSVLPVFKIKCNIENYVIIKGLKCLDSFKSSFESLNDREMSEVALMNKLNEKKEKYLKKGESDYYCDFSTKKDGNNIEISLKKCERECKIKFNSDNFYDKSYFIGDKLTKLKAELNDLNDKEITEDELNKKINELKDTYLKKSDSDCYDIINIEKTDKDINIKVKDLKLDDIKGLLKEQNYEFSLFKESNTENAPDYKPNKNKNLFEFLEGTGEHNIHKDREFFYYKLTVKGILEMIKNKLIEYSDKDKEGKVPYNFEIELLDKSENKINSSDSILEGGIHYIKIKDLFITKDQDKKVKNLEDLIKELENKSNEDTPFETSVKGKNYINQKQTEFTNLKTDLEKIEFCKLFLEKNEDLFINYTETLANKIKLLDFDEDVKKIIKEINKQITEFKEQIKTWQYKNFSDYLDEDNKIKNKKVEEYINSIIDKEKSKNKDKETEITNYFTGDTILNEINNINTSLNARLNELKYYINLVIKDNKKFKNEEYNNSFNKLIKDFNVCYADYTFKDLLLLIVGSCTINESDENMENNTKFYVNGSEITNLKDVITKNSTVEIEFDSSLYKDKNDKKDKDVTPSTQQNTNTENNGDDGNDGEVKKGCCANKYKSYGDKKK